LADIKERSYFECAIGKGGKLLEQQAAAVFCDDCLELGCCLPRTDILSTPDRLVTQHLR